MNLVDYTTPICDHSKVPVVRCHHSPKSEWAVSLRVAQDLERKLTMCREALENIQSNCENDAPSDPDCERSVSLAWIRDTAAEIIEATAP